VRLTTYIKDYLRTYLLVMTMLLPIGTVSDHSNVELRTPWTKAEQVARAQHRAWRSVRSYDRRLLWRTASATRNGHVTPLQATVHTLKVHQTGAKTLWSRWTTRSCSSPAEKNFYVCSSNQCQKIVALKPFLRPLLIFSVQSLQHFSL